MFACNALPLAARAPTHTPPQPIFIGTHPGDFGLYPRLKFADIFSKNIIYILVFKLKWLRNNRKIFKKIMQKNDKPGQNYDK